MFQPDRVHIFQIGNAHLFLKKPGKVSGGEPLAVAPENAAFLRQQISYPKFFYHIPDPAIRFPYLWIRRFVCIFVLHPEHTAMDIRHKPLQP